MKYSNQCWLRYFDMQQVFNQKLILFIIPYFEEIPKFGKLNIDATCFESKFHY